VGAAGRQVLWVFMAGTPASEVHACRDSGIKAARAVVSLTVQTAPVAVLQGGQGGAGGALLLPQLDPPRPGPLARHRRHLPGARPQYTPSIVYQALLVLASYPGVTPMDMSTYLAADCGGVR
jgi:hypothetical protein